VKLAVPIFLGVNCHANCVKKKRSAGGRQTVFGSPEDDGDDERHGGDGVHHGRDERCGCVLQAREVHVQS
jgi:hypothetical protein